MGNKHLSVLMLYVRSAIFLLLFTMALLIATQTGLFLWQMQHGAASLEAVVQSKYFYLAWAAVAALLIILLSRMQGGGYTVRRLRISERAAFLWHSLTCFLCYALLWMTEIITITVLCRYFLMQPAAADASEQTLFLAFYCNEFLHSILPLEEVSRWVWLIIAWVALALATADAVVQMRYGRKPSTLIPVALLYLWHFKQPLGSMTSDILLTLINLCCGAYAIWDVWFNAEEVETDEAD